MTRKLLILLSAAFLFLAACGDDPAEESNTDTTNDVAAGEDCAEEPTLLESGLKFEEIECGDGDEANRGDIVTVHYLGELEDGKKFDSSYDRGQPIQTQIGSGQLIPGFEEGVIGMKEGGKRRVTIPPELGYGKSGSGPIPPNATIVFEIELVEIQDV